jgi:hypothetical protein
MILFLLAFFSKSIQKGTKKDPFPFSSLFFTDKNDKSTHVSCVCYYELQNIIKNNTHDIAK